MTTLDEIDETEDDEFLDYDFGSKAGRDRFRQWLAKCDAEKCIPAVEWDCVVDEVFAAFDATEEALRLAQAREGEMRERAEKAEAALAAERRDVARANGGGGL